MYQFRDPVHGFIEVTDEERRIINSPPFQRLRNIRQLGTTYLVYHGAEHTRFGHSLGVMHLTSRVFDSVVKKNPNLFSKKQSTNEKRIIWYRQILRLIGLTHDLGHAPFSHGAESLFKNGKEHEDFTKKIICETEIAEHINSIGKQFQLLLGKSYNITPELVWMIYSGKDIIKSSFIMPDFLFLRSFMDGEMDCDKMDYLLRDSLFCGVSYGKYDLDRFISTLTACRTEDSLQLAVERGGIQALEEFILARYFMFIQVYFHKTRRYLDRALVNAMKAILPNGVLPDNTKDFLAWDDNRVLCRISDSDSVEAINFRDRRIMTCVYESKVHAEKTDTTNARIIFNIIEKEFGEDNVMYDSVDKAAHALSPAILAAKDDSGKGIMIIDEKSGQIKSLMEESLILESIVKPISIKRIYAKKEIANSVIRKIQDTSN